MDDDIFAMFDQVDEQRRQEREQHHATAVLSVPTDGITTSVPEPGVSLAENVLDASAPAEGTSSQSVEEDTAQHNGRRKRACTVNQLSSPAPARPTPPPSKRSAKAKKPIELWPANIRKVELERLVWAPHYQYKNALFPAILCVHSSETTHCKKIKWPIPDNERAVAFFSTPKTVEDTDILVVYKDKVHTSPGVWPYFAHPKVGSCDAADYSEEDRGQWNKRLMEELEQAIRNKHSASVTERIYSEITKSADEFLQIALGQKAPPSLSLDGGIAHLLFSQSSSQATEGAGEAVEGEGEWVTKERKELDTETETGEEGISHSAFVQSAGAEHSGEHDGAAATAAPPSSSSSSFASSGTSSSQAPVKVSRPRIVEDANSKVLHVGDYIGYINSGDDYSTMQYNRISGFSKSASAIRPILFERDIGTQLTNAPWFWVQKVTPDPESDSGYRPLSHRCTLDSFTLAREKEGREQVEVEGSVGRKAKGKGNDNSSSKAAGGNEASKKRKR